MGVTPGSVAVGDFVVDGSTVVLTPLGPRAPDVDLVCAPDPVPCTFDVLWLRASGHANAVALDVDEFVRVTRVSHDRCSVHSTGTGTVLANVAMSVLTNGRRTGDLRGEFASRGHVDDTLLARLLADRWGHDRAYLDSVTNGLVVRAEHLFATLVEFTARTAAQGCAGADIVIAAGSGMRDPALVRALTRHVPLRMSDEFGVPTGHKRGYAAALHGFLTRTATTATGLSVGGHRART
ncbi:anhydro-N-acetylmuramic acid kinase [Saccharothrix violaceirubra]|nr:anhydro-N-acetylmuramic acid kinase [Saccharothrix violaceirubra]